MTDMICSITDGLQYDDVKSPSHEQIESDAIAWRDIVEALLNDEMVAGVKLSDFVHEDSDELCDLVNDHKDIMQMYKNNELTLSARKEIIRQAQRAASVIVG